MHIHGGHMNPQSALSSTHASTLAAQRAEETRKKLFASAAELDAETTSESVWMISAWGGGNSGSSEADQQTAGQSSGQRASQDRSALSPTPAAGPVSFWA